jgi:copper chaperone CopZ
MTQGGITMFELRVEGMTCGGCAGRVTRAIQGVDGAAKVYVDLKSKTVQVETSADLDTVRSAVVSAGYLVTLEDAA